MDPRLSDHLRERLSDDLPSIRLDEQGEGAHITGMILAIKMVDLGFGEHPVVTLLSAKGNAGEMHLMGTVLEDEWAAAQPKIGDYIGVKNLGKKSSQSGEYHAWRFVHVSAELAAVLTDTLGTEGS